MDFDVELFLALTFAIFKVIPHDSMAIELWDGSVSSSIEDLAAAYASIPEIALLKLLGIL
ncbi:MAG: hypothetical protein ACREAB_10920 [Blastocatellia bacterium]